jgi:hypothetical protein
MAALLTLAYVQTATGSPGSWSAPVAVSPPAGLILDSVVGSDYTGKITVAWIIPQGLGPETGIWVRHRSPAGTWDEAANLDPLAEGGLAMDEDAAGHVCLLYARLHRRNALTARCTDPDGTFTRPVTLSPRTPYTDYHIVVDDHDTWTAAWTQRDRAGRLRIAVARRVSGVWRSPVLVSGPRQAVSDFDLDTSPQGVVTLAWAGRPRHLHQAPYRIDARTHAEGAGWGNTLTLSGPGSPTPDVASGRGERSRVVWLNGHDGVQRLQTRTHTTGGWGRIHTLVTSRRGQSPIWSPGIATGGRATTVVTWERAPTATVRGGIYALLHRHGRWGKPRALSPAIGTSDPPALLVNHSGTVWVLWQWKHRQITNADGWTLQSRVHQSAGAWSAVQDVSSADVVDIPASTALLPTDLPAITWISWPPKDRYQVMYSQTD